MVRILIAGILGGLVMFIGGAFSHVFLDLETRSFKRLPDEAAAVEFYKAQGLVAGMYNFPSLPGSFANLSSEEQAKVKTAVNSAYKTGPAGYLIVAPTGEDLMGPRQLIGEFVSNVIAALLAAFIAAHFSTAASFSRRWLLIVLLAPISWFSLTLSFAIWFRFPYPMIQDGLFGALIEWTLVGAVIAGIVRPIMHHR